MENTFSARHQEGKKEIEWVHTLYGMDDAIVCGRRVGNTTRLADNAIQILFSGKGCIVRDHWQDGAHSQANEHLLNQILRRLFFEHKILRELIEIDRGKLRICLKLQ